MKRPDVVIRNKSLNQRNAVKNAWKQGKIKYNGGMTGKCHTEKTKNIIREKNKNYKPTLITRKKLGEYNKRIGRRPPIYYGKENILWKGGITSLNKQITTCFKYRLWRSDVFIRDNFICQECNNRSGKLEAHHIIKFSHLLYKNKIKNLQTALNCEELWNINNGQTLCKNCHKITKTYGRSKETGEIFEP